MAGAGRGRKPDLVAIEGGLSEAMPPPEWLGDAARAEWSRVMPDLARRKVLTRADLGTLENYCAAIGQVRDCQRAIDEDGQFVQSDRSAPRPHPGFRVMHSAMTIARQLAGELGLTPVARQRAGVKEDDGGADEWAGLVKG